MCSSAVFTHSVTDDCHWGAYMSVAISKLYFYENAEDTSRSLIAAFNIYHRCESYSTVVPSCFKFGKRDHALVLLYSLRNSAGGVSVVLEALEPKLAMGWSSVRLSTSLAQLDDCVVADLKLHLLYQRLHFYAKFY